MNTRSEQQADIVKQYKGNSDYWYEEMKNNKYLSVDSADFREWKNAYDRYNLAFNKLADLETREIIQNRIDELNEHYQTLKSSKAQQGIIAQVGALKWVLENI